MNTGLLRYAVGTVLTVYGIETSPSDKSSGSSSPVGTVLTVYGIETAIEKIVDDKLGTVVGTVLTVYGIETI